MRFQKEAETLFQFMQTLLNEPGLLPAKLIEETRKLKALAVPMIMIVTAQILRDGSDNKDLCNQVIDRAMDEIEKDFLKPEFKAVLETVGQNGEFFDHFEGRMLCPGHAIEAAWFILNESKYRKHDQKLRKLGLQILDWSLSLGFLRRQRSNFPIVPLIRALLPLVQGALY